MKKASLAFAFGVLFFPLAITAQEARREPVSTRVPGGDRIDNGIELYEQGRLQEAMQQFRQARQDARSPEDAAEALFWMAAVEISNGEYERAIYDLDEIRYTDPASVRLSEVPYHKGRAFFYLKRYGEAVRYFQEYEQGIRIDGRYINSIRLDNYPADTSYENIQIEYNKKAAALYWIGECYYYMNNFEQALGYYTIIVDQYMKSRKYESSLNRIALINQKKVEDDLRDELNRLLKPQPETPAAPEAYTGGPSYDEAILAYQNRIAPYLMLRAMGEEQKAPKAEPVKTETPPAAPVSIPGRNEDPDATKRLLVIKTGALSILDRLISTLNTYEIIEAQRW